MSVERKGIGRSAKAALFGVAGLAAVGGGGLAIKHEVERRGSAEYKQQRAEEKFKEIQKEFEWGQKELLNIVKAIFQRMEKSGKWSGEELAKKREEAKRDPTAFIFKYNPEEGLLDTQAAIMAHQALILFAADRIPALAQLGFPVEKIRSMAFQLVQVDPAVILHAPQAFRLFPFFDDLIREACDRQGTVYEKFMQDFRAGKIYDESPESKTRKSDSR